MKSLKGSKTLENLARAFAGEAQARARYTYYAEVAKKEKYIDIYYIFKITANNERAHGKVFLDLIVEGGCSGNIDISAGYPFAIGQTLDNLKEAANGEQEEFTDVYPNFEKIAIEEGYPEVATAFRNIISVEKEHHKRFKDLYELVNQNKFFRRDTVQYWECENCGYIYEGESAPMACPLCKYPQGYFKVKSEK